MREGKTERREGATIHPIFSGLSLNPLYLLLQRKTPHIFFKLLFIIELLHRKKILEF
jgi:hypothetical protein